LIFVLNFRSALTNARDSVDKRVNSAWSTTGRVAILVHAITICAGSSASPSIGVTGEEGETLELAGIALMVCLSERGRARPEPLAQTKGGRGRRTSGAEVARRTSREGELQQDVQNTEVNRSVREIDSFESELDSFECGQRVEVSAVRVHGVRETTAQAGGRTEVKARRDRFFVFWGVADISAKTLIPKIPKTTVPPVSRTQLPL